MVICSDEDDNNKVAEKTQDVNFSYLMKIALDFFQYLSNDEHKKIVKNKKNISSTFVCFKLCFLTL